MNISKEYQMLKTHRKEYFVFYLFLYLENSEKKRVSFK